MTASRIGSLFSGYGGLDSAALALLGPESRVVWHCDIKPAAVTLLARRDPGVPNLGDITKIDPASVEPVDALTFGWPCQPHSSAGKRLGEADPRALWPEVARLIGGLRPRYLFGENVARVASNGELRRVVQALADLGYVGTWRCLRASDVGAPHGRPRLFLFAAAADTDGAELQRGRPADERADERPGPADSGGAARFGRYARAVRRWERVLGRVAPDPTVDGRLNPRLAEWMMGLPAGWVTEVPGLCRKDQFSLLGDGVVPQQAIAAFSELTARMFHVEHAA